MQGTMLLTTLLCCLSVSSVLTQDYYVLDPGAGDFGAGGNPDIVNTGFGNFRGAPNLPGLLV